MDSLIGGAAMAFYDPANLLNKRITHCLNKRIRFQKSSIVITLPPGLVAT
jgi:hypothetical protein